MSIAKTPEMSERSDALQPNRQNGYFKTQFMVHDDIQCLIHKHCMYNRLAVSIIYSKYQE